MIIISLRIYIFIYSIKFDLIKIFLNKYKIMNQINELPLEKIDIDTNNESYLYQFSFKNYRINSSEGNVKVQNLKNIHYKRIYQNKGEFLTEINNFNQFEINKTDKYEMITKEKFLNLHPNIIKQERTLMEFNKVYDSFEDDEIIGLENTEDKLLIINLKGKFKSYMDICCICLIFLSSIISPMNICFFGNTFLMFFQKFIDLMFIIEILLIFCTQIYDENDNIINDRIQIASNYLKKWFLVDSITTFPSFYFNYSNILINNLKWLVVFRMFKLTKYNLLLQFKLFHDSKLNRVFKLIIMLILATHICSCMWIYIGKTKDLDNWIYTFINESSNFDLYIASIYFHLVSIYTIGYGDIFPQNSKERIYVCFLLIVGVMLFSFTVSSLSKLFVDDSPKFSEFEKKVRYLKEIRKDYKINRKLYFLIKTDLKNELSKNYSDRIRFIEDLPTNIKHQLAGAVYEFMIKDLQFFKNQSFNFILFALPLLKLHKFNKDQKLVSIGETFEEMYLVINGCLSITLGTDLNNLEIGMVRESHHFGDLFLQTNEKARFDLTIKSKTAELFILKKKNFSLLKSIYNENMFEIMNESYLKFETLNKRSNQYQKLIKYGNSVNNLKKILCLLNTNLMERGFDDYYNHDTELIDINYFLDNHDFEYVKNYIKKINESKKNTNHYIKEFSNLFRPIESTMNCQNKIVRKQKRKKGKKSNLVTKKLLNVYNIK